MIGLVSARSGVFIWTTRVPQIRREDVGSFALRFDPSGSRFLISLEKVIYVIEPPCLSKKPQRHPMHHELSLGETSQTYEGTEILEITKAWPKEVLFNVLLAGQREKPEIQYFLLDVAISLTSNKLALICRKHEGHCFLSLVDYSQTPSWELFWFVVFSQWSQSCLSNNTSLSVKEIGEDQSRKGIAVFFYHNAKSYNEQIVLFSSKGGIEMLDLDSRLRELSKWNRVSDESCFSFTQSKDRRRVISLADRHVLIIDLNERKIVKSVHYLFGLRQWWTSFLNNAKFFGYSHYYKFGGREWDHEHNLFVQDSLLGLFDVSNDGDTILIGWDSKQNRSLTLTSKKTEEQFRIEWEGARESLWQCSMMTCDGQWLGFIDYKKLRGGDIVFCVVDTISE